MKHIMQLLCITFIWISIIGCEGVQDEIKETGYKLDSIENSLVNFLKSKKINYTIYNQIILLSPEPCSFCVEETKQHINNYYNDTEKDKLLVIYGNDLTCQEGEDVTCYKSTSKALLSYDLIFPKALLFSVENQYINSPKVLNE